MGKKGKALGREAAAEMIEAIYYQKGLSCRSGKECSLVSATLHYIAYLVNPVGP